MKPKFILLLSFLTLLTSCMDFDDATQPISVKVQVQMPDALKGADVSGHIIIMNLGGQTISAKTEADGVASFKDIVPDVYDISTSWKMSPYEYVKLTGEKLEEWEYKYNFSISANKSSQILTKEGEQLTLNAKVSHDQPILISKVYYAGSKDNNNKNYLAGKYIELYNNSDEDYDASGLYIALMESESTIAYTPGQVMDTIFAKQVFRIPADKAFIVEPGGSVLIVNSAIDHSGQGPNERNLLSADFEAKDKQGKTTNNPNVPELQLVYSTYSLISQLNMVQSGPCSVIIFSTSEDVLNWPTAYAYGKTKGSLFMKIPTSSVIDGVDILSKKAQTGVDVNTKRLYDYIDAGYTNINATSGYNGEVVYRKIESTATDGRKILKDTNNSQNDFDVTTDINPREYK